MMIAASPNFDHGRFKHQDVGLVSQAEIKPHPGQHFSFSGESPPRLLGSSAHGLIPVLETDPLSNKLTVEVLIRATSLTIVIQH